MDGIRKCFPRMSNDGTFPASETRRCGDHNTSAHGGDRKINPNFNPPGNSMLDALLRALKARFN
jgi:hypothetical protein